MDTPGSLVVCSRIWPLELGQPFVGKAGFEASAADDIGQNAPGDWASRSHPVGSGLLVERQLSPTGENMDLGAIAWA